LGIAGVFLAFFYNARPLLMGYGSLGEVATGIGFGPLVVMGAYYVCARHLTIAIFLNSIPIGILIALVLLINEFPDWQGDQAVQKKTWVVILGKQKAAMIYRSALVLAYVLILCLIAAGCLPIFCLVVLLSLPLAWKALRVARIHYDKVWELLPANAATIGLHAGVGLLLCLGIVLDKMMTRM
jgi:1,4-dihydroxy-2-naphthoate octaprenyltransferase